jgi:hypothetical protein
LKKKWHVPVIDVTYKQTILKSFDVEHYQKKERKAVIGRYNQLS